MIDFKQIIPLHYMECNPKRKRLVRLGCAALALTLAVGSVSFLRGWAAEDDAAVSGSDIVTQSYMTNETAFVSSSDAASTAEENEAKADNDGTVVLSETVAPKYRASSVFNWVKANSVTDFNNAAHGSNSRINYYSGVTNWLHSSGQAFAEAQGLDYRKCYFLTSWDGSRFIAAYKDQPSSVVTTGYKNASEFENLVNQGVTFFYVPYTATEDISLAETVYEVNVGETLNILPTLTPAWSNDLITWESADTNVATVEYSTYTLGRADGCCQVTGVGAGITTLTATVNGHTATCQVAVSGELAPDLSNNRWVRLTSVEELENARTFDEDFLCNWHETWMKANENKRVTFANNVKTFSFKANFVLRYEYNERYPEYSYLYYVNSSSYVRDISIGYVDLARDFYFYIPKSDVTFTYHAVVKPTCTEAGSIAYWTDQDGNKFADANTETRLTDEEIPLAATGHTWGNWTETTAPSCETAGEETRVCANDANHTETREIAAIGHDWGSWTTTTPATCAAPGEKTRTCKNDSNHTETEVIPALSHNWYAWTDVEGQPGLVERDCAVCSAHETRIHPLLAFVVTAGNGQTYTKGSQEPLTVKYDKEDIPDLKKVDVYQMFTNNGGSVNVTAPDGTVTTLGAGDFTPSEGSLDVTLSAGYLEGLKDGDYTMTVTFVVAPDYEKTSAAAVFTVSSPAPAGSDSPSTGESVLLISVSAVLLILAAFGVVFAIRRRRAQGE